MPAILTALAAATLLQPQADDPERLQANLDSLVIPLVQAYDFAGTVLITKGADTLLLAAYGDADIEAGIPNSGSTAMRIGSISKQFTSAAVLLLQQDGVLDVQDPLARFLPDFPEGDSIRLHHLLTHQSGIVRDVFEDWTERQSPRTLDALVTEIASRPLDFAPGSRSSYSNAGYTILASVVERVSGTSFADFLESRIFAPLDMRQTAIREGSSQGGLPTHLAVGYDPGPYPQGLVKTPWEDPSNTLGADGMDSSVGDLHIWSEALESDALLSAQSRKQRWRAGDRSHMDRPGGRALPGPQDDDWQGPVSSPDSTPPSDPSGSDEALMVAVRDGDIERLGVLFDRYHCELYRFLLRFIGDPALAEDAVQDAFLRVLRHRSSYQAGMVFRPWLVS